MALVAGTGLAVAATLRLRDLPRLILGAYVVGFAEVVGLILLLSAFGAVKRTAILAALAGLFAASVAGWFLSGAPRLPPVPVGRLRALRRTPILLVLAVATGLALLYVLALIVGTPPNNHDSFTYHLTRAAFWSQADGVGNIADAYDERLNAHPPTAEIALTFVLELGRHERLAGFIQFAAALASAIGVYAIARKLTLPRREAAFGGLLFLTLPIILLEASTTQNDLVVASFLVAATVFVLGESKRELVLAGLATALALGTKVPAAYGVVVLGGLALVALPGRFRVQRITAVLVGIALGSYWYLANLVRTGRALGDLSDTGDVRSVLEPSANFFAGYARVLDAFDLSGATGDDILVYPIVAAVVAVALVVSRRAEVFPALVTAAVIMTPLLFLPVGYALWRVFAKLHDVVDEPDGRLPVQGWLSQTSPSNDLSWFGPLGILLIVGVGVAVIVLFRRGSIPRTSLVLAGAPLAWLVMVSATLAYDPWQGRFFIYPVAVAASLWGLVLRVPPLAVAVVAVAATTATLSLVHYAEKPSGLRLVEADVLPSVWGEERWVAQAVPQTDSEATFRFLDELPRNDRLALALGMNDSAFPAFGPRLERRVELVPQGSSGEAIDSDWLLANLERAQQIDRSCWTVVLTTPDGWKGFRRNAAACGS